MKLQLTFLFCFIGSVAAFAQGTVNFNNSPASVGGTGAPVFDVDGMTRLEGNAWLAMLWAGPDGNSLTPWGQPLTFRTGAAAGFFNTTGVDTSRTIGTVAPGAPATIQVRVWEAAGGDYFEAAEGGYKFFSSATFTVTTGGAGSPPSLPANLVGLTSFSLVPEPTTRLLFAVGVIAWIIRRHRSATQRNLSHTVHH